MILFNQSGPDSWQNDVGVDTLFFQWCLFWVWRTIFVSCWSFFFPRSTPKCETFRVLNWLTTWSGKSTRCVTTKLSLLSPGHIAIACHDQISANLNPIPYNAIFQFYMSAVRYSFPPKKMGRHPKNELNSKFWTMMKLDLLRWPSLVSPKQIYLPSHLDMPDMKVHQRELN